MSKKVNARKHETVRLEEEVVYADGLTECPWCGGALETDSYGKNDSVETVSATCMSCYATFPFKAARWRNNSPMADDDEIPFHKAHQNE